MVLEYLLKELHSVKEVKVLFATGTHRIREEDIDKLLDGVEVDYKVHDAWDIDDHVYIGETSRGLKVYVDKDYFDADIKILVGVVVPHPWAGFSGGAKLILPGISAARTINEHHTRWFLHRNAKAGILEGNVFRDQIEEAAGMVGVDYSLNTVTVGNNIVYSSWSKGLDSFNKCVEVSSNIFL